MKRSTIIAATLILSLAPMVMASPAIMKEAKAKNPKIAGCKDCHSALPGTKTNLTPEGKKWAPAAKK